MSTQAEVDAFILFLHQRFIENGVTKAATIKKKNSPKLSHAKSNNDLAVMEQVVGKKLSEATLVTPAHACCGQPRPDSRC